MDAVHKRNPGAHSGKDSSFAEQLSNLRNALPVESRATKVTPVGELVTKYDDALLRVNIDGTPGEVTESVNDQLKAMLRTPYFAANARELRIHIPGGTQHYGRVWREAVGLYGLELDHYKNPSILWMIRSVEYRKNPDTGAPDPSVPPSKVIVAPFSSNHVMIRHGGFVEEGGRVLARVSHPTYGFFYLSQFRCKAPVVKAGTDPISGYAIVRESDIKPGSVVQVAGHLFLEHLDVVLQADG